MTDKSFFGAVLSIGVQKLGTGSFMETTVLELYRAEDIKLYAKRIEDKSSYDNAVWSREGGKTKSKLTTMVKNE